MSDLSSTVTAAFEERFDGPPQFIVRAPGRVNLIGEHTDYNDGFVLPMAIDRAVWLALRPRPDRQVIVHSLNFSDDGPAVIDLDHITRQPGSWGEYVRGVAWAFEQSQLPLHGWEGVLYSDVPVGAGLSSSAALELAIARAFAALSNAEWDPAKMALLGQKVENEWLGVNSGIMDQMISAAGKADHALLIDCRSLTSEAVALPPETAVVILDTATRRGLVDSAYNERRERCEAAAAFFGVSHLRDVSYAEFVARQDELDPITRARALHVISENARTLAAVAAMNMGNASEMGRLMQASHASLRDDFAVSSDALDTMVDIAMGHPATFGARMTGAGFGGCAVALVAAEHAEGMAIAVAQEYLAQTGREPKVYICQATDGTQIIQTTDHRH